MKFPSLFSRVPQHRKFSYTPRWYDADEEERRERRERVEREAIRELQQSQEEQPDSDYRSRIAGSFKSARRTASRQTDPSASMLRLIILTFLAIWLIAFIQFGNVAFYGLLLFIPFYILLKLRGKRNEQ